MFLHVILSKIEHLRIVIKNNLAQLEDTSEVMPIIHSGIMRARNKVDDVLISVGTLSFK